MITDGQAALPASETLRAARVWELGEQVGAASCGYGGGLQLHSPLSCGSVNPSALSSSPQWSYSSGPLSQAFPAFLSQFILLPSCTKMYL